MAKRRKKSKKKLPIFWLYIVGALIVLFLILGIFLFPPKIPASMRVSSENPKQGDTVFIKVKSEAGQVVGNFDKEKLDFYKNGNLPEWIAFLGIDADHQPGDYKIFVDTSNAEHLTKDIKVVLADFSSAKAVAAPSQKQTGITNEKAVSNITKKDNPSINKILGTLTPSPYFTNSFSFPLDKIETGGLPFGKFISFAKYKIQHFGVDLKAPKNSKVYAVNDGKVVAVLNLSNYGKTVIIDHGLDIFSLYLHLEEFKVAEGSMVKKGQIIGLSGDTGYTTAPHLHFSIRVDGSRVDPIAFIEASKNINGGTFIGNLTADIAHAFLNIFK